MTFGAVERYRNTKAWDWARRSWVGDFVRAARIGRRNFVKAAKTCPYELWSWVRSENLTLPSARQLAQALAAMRTSSDDSIEGEIAEAPVFVLSTGWRAGSTLLQRILVTDPRLLVWGEPLGEMMMVSRIAEMLSDSLSPRDLDLWYKQDGVPLSSLPTSWIAALSPPANDLRSALRLLFCQWLAEPARRQGFTRWGLKEVRLGATEATLLHWLFPRARFVILSRHPYDCYQSFADSGWEYLYYRHPEVRIDTIAAFARHWNRLALDWSQLPAGFPGFRIKYEDLINGKVDFRRLEAWLGIEIHEERALSTSVGGTARRSRLSWFERLIIGREAAAGMSALGYSK